MGATIFDLSFYVNCCEIVFPGTGGYFFWRSFTTWWENFHYRNWRLGNFIVRRMVEFSNSNETRLFELFESSLFSLEIRTESFSSGRTMFYSKTEKTRWRHMWHKSGLLKRMVILNVYEKHNFLWSNQTIQNSQCATQKLYGAAVWIANIIVDLIERKICFFSHDYGVMCDAIKFFESCSFINVSSTRGGGAKGDWSPPRQVYNFIEKRL